MSEGHRLSIRPMRDEDLDAVSLIESAVQRFPWRRQQFEDAIRAGYQAWVLLAPAPIAAPALVPGRAAVGGAEEKPLQVPASPEGREARPPSGTVPAASQAEAILGYAILMPVVEEVELLTLAVAARWQGRGVGRRLLGWLQSRARATGMQSMLLEVAAGNEAALTLYRRAGFQCVGQRRGYYRRADGMQDDAWVMRCHLDEPGLPADEAIHVLD